MPHDDLEAGARASPGLFPHLQGPVVDRHDVVVAHPARLLELGFRFRFPDAGSALADLLRS